MPNLQKEADSAAGAKHRSRWPRHHRHSRGQQQDTKALTWVLVLNMSFTALEFVGGWWSNSAAVLSDAFHDLGDSVAISLALVFERISRRRSTGRYSYGYGRFSPLAALINSLVLAGGSIFIGYHGVVRLLNPEPVQAPIMMGIACFGVVANGAAVYLLASKRNNMNQRTVMLHLLEDVLGWVAVLVGGTVMLVWGLPWIDGLLTVGIAVYILANALRNIGQLVPIFLQAAPQEVAPDLVLSRLEQLGDAVEITDLHLWSLDGDYTVLTLHLQVREPRSAAEAERLKAEVRELLADQNIDHFTIDLDQRPAVG